MPVLPNSVSALASMIDHTLLKQTATFKDIELLCEEAIKYQFASVCVNPCYVPKAAQLLKGQKPVVCSVIGFPLGQNSTEIKKAEASWCVANGAVEIDMVINIGMIKSNDFSAVSEDIKAVVNGSGKSLVKVILECCYLSKEEIARVCQIAESSGARFVKTSTGFGSGGATVEDVMLMKRTVPGMLVKASGGIRDLKTAYEMIKAGADRLGVSAGVSIIKEMEGGDADLSSGY